MNLPARLVTALFVTTTFIASALLFVVQPMFARMVLPKLGGSASVWNTCVLFFQTMLLAGYVYAHITTAALGVRRQMVLQIVVMAVAFAVLPFGLGQTEAPAGSNPVWWLLRTLTVRLGLPFLVVATMAPLVQRWFATLPVRSASNPYFLYAASNTGSMLALLGYPLALERALGTAAQTRLWALGYGILLALVAACLVIVARFGRAIPAAGADPLAPRSAADDAPLRPARWIILAFIPSSLMLGVTTHISTDLASIPLLWVLPLATYLWTFIIAFSQRTRAPGRAVNRVFPAVVLLVSISILLQWNHPRLIPLHLAAFFVTALVCHTALARSRPAPKHLTAFYMWMSLGGALGGVFNTLIAPHLFNGVFEYPAILALACFLRASPRYRNGQPEPWGMIAAIGIVPLATGTVLWALARTPPGLGLAAVLASIDLVALTVFTAFNRTAAFNLSMLFSTLLLIVSPPHRGGGVTLFAGRSFFGVIRVIEARDHSYRLLQHGSTLHGRQNLPAGSSCEPQSYYHPASPVGELLRKSGTPLTNVAVIGLGSGGLACYAKPGETWTFFEIDPLVERVARNPGLFTFLENSRGFVRVSTGDGRKKVEEANPDSYDLIVLDAFSSDSVPVHLITREALRLYLTRLHAGGIVAYHISNRYLDLEPVVGTLARAEGLAGLAKLDGELSAIDAAAGRVPSHWVVLSQSERSIGSLAGLPGWHAPASRRAGNEWTDDYSNLLETVRLLR